MIYMIKLTVCVLTPGVTMDFSKQRKENITMATLTIILLVSTAFALGDCTIRPKTPCERARDAMKNRPPTAYIPTCDCKGQYTPEQCWGSTGSCWCVTCNGQKIKGTETPPGTAPIKCATLICS
ncbi:equistatin-like [Coregonus clupeaformis]|uniref:equistatin-like n=2 Tax=Coregonus clupeaformis TaxID=59861 RepID=UPI001E1C8D7A|nr:equistatin-like [Coregonus clupeaformis]